MPTATKTSIDWDTEVLLELSEDERLNPKFTSEDRVTFYSDNAAKYDGDMVVYEVT